MNAIGRKRDYVLGQSARADGHRCHAEGCPRPVRPAFLMCGPHWRRVPRAIQRRIWAEYRAGQEKDKRPSDAYLRAMEDAIEAVAEKEGRREGTL